MKNNDIIEIKKALNKYVVKSPLATRNDVINRMMLLVNEMGFNEIPIELLKFAMAIPLEVNLI